MYVFQYSSRIASKTLRHMLGDSQLDERCLNLDLLPRQSLMQGVGAHASFKSRWQGTLGGSVG